MKASETQAQLRAKKPSSRYYSHETHVNDDRIYTAEERVFMLTIEKWKRDNHCPHPNLAQVLAIAKALGYRKVGVAREEVVSSTS